MSISTSRIREPDLNRFLIIGQCLGGGEEVQKHFDKFGNTRLEVKRVQTLNYKSMMAVLKTSERHSLHGHKCVRRLSARVSHRSFVSLQTDEDSLAVTCH